MEEERKNGEIRREKKKEKETYKDTERLKKGTMKRKVTVTQSKVFIMAFW